MRLIPMNKVKDMDQFWRGTRFRIYNVGMNVKNKKEDYYEYMLAEIPGDSYMILTIVEGHKSGKALASVKLKKSKTKRVVTGKALKFSMGTKNIFWLKVKSK
jgi:hypothetical protein